MGHKTATQTVLRWEIRYSTAAFENLKCWMNHVMKSEVMSDSCCLCSLRFRSPLFLSILPFITTMMQCFSPRRGRAKERAELAAATLLNPFMVIRPLRVPTDRVQDREPFFIEIRVLLNIWGPTNFQNVSKKYPKCLQNLSKYQNVSKMSLKSLQKVSKTKISPKSIQLFSKNYPKGVLNPKCI